MQIFVTYAREDRARVVQLVEDLRQAQHQVWMDTALRGGQVWWDTILSQIARSDVYLFQLSPASLASRACRAEYDYAVALLRQIVVVRVADIDPATSWPELVAHDQVDLRARSVESAITLVTGLAALLPPPGLPDPLPDPPPVPITYLSTLHDRIGAATLSEQEQGAILEEIIRCLSQDDERDAGITLLHRLGRRNDLTPTISRRVGELLARDRRPGERRSGRRHPSLIPVAVLVVIGPLLFGTTAVLAIFMANRALREIDRQPGRFRTRRALSVWRICAFVAVGLGLAYPVLLYRSGA